MIEQIALGLFWIVGFVAGTLVKIWRWIKAAFVAGYERGVKVKTHE